MLTPKDKNWLDTFEGAVDSAWEALTKWEKKFCEDILEKYRLQGIDLTLSKKQWEVIANISEKIGL